MRGRFGYIVQSLFFAGVGTVVLLWMILSIRNGSLSWGGGAQKMAISTSDAPVVFWAAVSVGGLLGAAVTFGNLKNAIKVIRRRRDNDKE